MFIADLLKREAVNQPGTLSDCASEDFTKQHNSRHQTDSTQCVTWCTPMPYSTFFYFLQHGHNEHRGVPRRTIDLSHLSGFKTTSPWSALAGRRVATGFMRRSKEHHNYNDSDCTHRHQAVSPVNQARRQQRVIFQHSKDFRGVLIDYGSDSEACCVP